ncbi:AAA family ATPase [Pseudonocardia sediminis]|uniref:AAA family ATPase n=1 Tax=Pseudonocardia sediminis TaxID=1397368 RepID=UPI001A91F659|nr:LuxR family transcriptional regulator [Pseudonocardia sediminis]
MGTDRVDRPAETRVVTAFLDAAARAPAALVIDGEPGIGKTTLWRAALERAHRRGFRALAARPAEAESRMAYATVADLLADVDPADLHALPHPQRRAVDRVLLHTDDGDGGRGATTDHRVLGAALLSVTTLLAERSPVLLALDDLQWIDPSSRQVIAFAARRLAGPAGVLATARPTPDGLDAAAWLQLSEPGARRGIRVEPMSLGALHGVVAERTGRSLPRPAMARIHEVSGGNPFYALELARTIDPASTDVAPPLPATLAELVRARVGGVGPETAGMLLAMAALADPTVELLQRATGGHAAAVTGWLEEAENAGVITIAGNRPRFTHPLLATGVYAGATPSRRRHLHRTLATIVDQPELRARHLALATIRGDDETLDALDDAAARARARGAPAAAAELLTLAIGLGGDTPPRRMRLARHHLDAGDTEAARRTLEETVASLEAGPLRAQVLSLLAMVRLHDDSYLDAAGLLEQALDEAGDDTGLRGQVLVELPYALVNLGRVGEAVQLVERAVTVSEDIGDVPLLSRALGMRVVLRFMAGHGADETGLHRATALEDRGSVAPVMFRPSVLQGLMLAWTGRLGEAHEVMTALRQRCVDRGEENDLVFMGFHSVLTEIWRGDLAGATLIAEDSMERARQLGTDVPLAVALSLRAMVAALDGRADEARRCALEALATYRRCDWHTLEEWPISTLGFLELSLGEDEAALTTLEPLIGRARAGKDGMGEIVTSSFVPDAVEALVGTGRLDEARTLLDDFDERGHALRRDWTLATAARCRALLLAAEGDVEGATAAAERAIGIHRDLPMPFERARTLLVLGRLQRRARRKGAAAETLRAALEVFDALPAPLWAARARAELDRVGPGPARTSVLTPSEQRVAELAASGMTNREVSAALFISPKTVEANLSRVYRKLGIHSRAELGRRVLDL